MALPASSSAPRSGSPIRVVVIDDSAVVRGLVKRWLSDVSDIVVAAYAFDGQEGVNKVRAEQPDVVVLDVEMPRMGGLEALPEILKAKPGVRVLMASTLTHKGADVTLQALSLGAADFLAKPDAGKIAGADAYKRDLVEKIRALGRFGRAGSRAVRARAAAAPTPTAAWSKDRPSALFIGSSTGGPQALRTVIGAIGAINAPIFIAQHMPATFTRILAEHLDRETPATAMEAKDGAPVRPGHIYVAPGDFHMTVRARGASPVVALDQRPPENFCRPAVDPLFRSAAEVYGSRALCVVLTGMGHDGAKGSSVVRAAGGSIIAQDEASSVVWGMPGAVVNEGVVAAITPLDAIGPLVVDVFKGTVR